MHMKIINKIMYSILIVMLITNIYSIFTYHVSADMFDDANSFIKNGEDQIDVDLNEVTNQFEELGQILTNIGAGVLVAVTTFMGIKYIMAGPETQAKLKQQLIGVIVSAIVIFGAYGIWQTVGKIAAKF